MDQETEDPKNKVLVFRNPAGQPVAVPEAVALEHLRPYRAYKLHQQGLSWALVADKEGYPDPSAARGDVTRYLREARSLVNDYTRREMLSLEMERLNTLQAVAWPAAMEGNMPALQFCSDQVMRRIKALRLDEVAEGEEELTGPRTVVVQGEADSYEESLREIISSD